MRKTLMVLTLAMVSAVARADDAAKPTLFVAPLDHDLSQIQGWQPAMGEGLAEMLITELAKLNKFDVLESTALPDLIKEINLGEDGYVGQDEKVQKGGFAGADFMFRGKVTQFGQREQGVDLTGFVPHSLGSLGVKQVVANVRIDWRFVDVATRRILRTGHSEGRYTGTGFDIGVGVDGHGGDIGFSNREFMNSALGRATVKALSNVLEEVSTVELPESGRQKARAARQIQHEAQTQVQVRSLHEAPGTILAVPSRTELVVGVGTRQGFNRGDRLQVFQTIDTKNDKGEVVFTEEKLVGEVTLEAVQEERSKASYKGDFELKEGWTVRAKSRLDAP